MDERNEEAILDELVAGMMEEEQQQEPQDEAQTNQEQAAEGTPSEQQPQQEGQPQQQEGQQEGQQQLTPEQIAQLQAQQGQPQQQPTPEQIAQMQAQQQGQQEQPQQGDQSAILEKLAANQEALQKAIELQNQPKEELSEEELAMRELADKLGVSKTQEENQRLKDELQQIKQQQEEWQKQQQAEQAKMQEQQRLNAEINKFKAEYPNADEDAIMNYIEQQPPHLQQALDTPEGWRMVQKMIDQSTQTEKPDDITSTKAGGEVQKPASARKKAGEQVPDEEIIDEILSL